MANSSWQMIRYHDDDGNQLFPLDAQGGLQCEWDIIEATEEMATLEDDEDEVLTTPQQQTLCPLPQQLTLLFTQPERTDE